MWPTPSEDCAPTSQTCRRCPPFALRPDPAAFCPYPPPTGHAHSCPAASGRHPSPFPGPQTPAALTPAHPHVRTETASLVMFSRCFVSTLHSPALLRTGANPTPTAGATAEGQQSEKWKQCGDHVALIPAGLQRPRPEPQSCGRREGVSDTPGSECRTLGALSW